MSLSSRLATALLLALYRLVAWRATTGNRIRAPSALPLCTIGFPHVPARRRQLSSDRPGFALLLSGQLSPCDRTERASAADLRQ